MSAKQADLKVVANAYLDSCRSGKSDQDAFAKALNVYRARHTEMPEGEANARVRRLIAEASEQFGLWQFRTNPHTYVEDDE